MSTQLLGTVHLTVSCVTSPSFLPTRGQASHSSWRADRLHEMALGPGSQETAGARPSDPAAEQYFRPLSSRVPLLSEVRTWPRRLDQKEEQLSVGHPRGGRGRGRGRGERLYSDL